LRIEIAVHGVEESTRMVLFSLVSLFRTGFKNLLICCQDHPRPQEPAEAVLPTKPNLVKNQVSALQTERLGAKQGIINHGIQNHNGGTDHHEDIAEQELTSPNTNGQLSEKPTTSTPRTRSAEIHGSKLKEKKRQKQQQRWSFTENPSGGSTSSSGPVDGAKMAAVSSGHVATVRIIDKWPTECAVRPQHV
jgi:hypothetical protein